jgi:threonine synthase
MKADRIVGGSKGGIRAALQAREPYYDVSYDVRVTVNADDSVEQVTSKVERALEERGSHFVSTRDKSGGKRVSFGDAVARGIADDGGLFVPNRYLPFGASELSRMSALPFPRLMRRVLEKFPLGGISAAELDNATKLAYSSFPADAVPLREAGDVFYLETWHGPTASFKDVSLQLLPHLLRLSSAGSSSGPPRALLCATSGDTGSAAVVGFAASSLPAIVLYPAAGVSPVQRLQMIRTRARVLAVKGNFDECQRIVKRLLGNASSKLVAANSIVSRAFVPFFVYLFFFLISFLRMLVVFCLKWHFRCKRTAR